MIDLISGLSHADLVTESPRHGILWLHTAGSLRRAIGINITSQCIWLDWARTSHNIRILTLLNEVWSHSLFESSPSKTGHFAGNRISGNTERGIGSRADLPVVRQQDIHRLLAGLTFKLCLGPVPPNDTANGPVDPRGNGIVGDKIANIGPIGRVDDLGSNLTDNLFRGSHANTTSNESGPTHGTDGIARFGSSINHLSKLGCGCSFSNSTSSPPKSSPDKQQGCSYFTDRSQGGSVPDESNCFTKYVTLIGKLFTSKDDFGQSILKLT